VACTVGVKYIGYNMIAFGIANFVFSVIVGVLSRRLAAEALVGVATVLQLGLAVFLLVWIPDRNLTPVLFAVSALWGMCDAIWQIECNCKYSLLQKNRKSSFAHKLSCSTNQLLMDCWC